MKRGITITVALILLILHAGCMWGRPGMEVQQGMQQQQHVGWSAEGNFTQDAVGPQTNKMLMAEGTIVMKQTEDGEAVIDFEKSAITSVLITDPSAKDASNALAQAFAASTAQAEMFGKSMETILSMLVPIIQAKIPNPPPPDAGGGSDTGGGMTREDVINIIRDIARNGGTNPP